MKRLALLLLVLFSFQANAAPPQNLYDCQKSVMTYHDSGQYMKDMTEAVKPGMDYLEWKVKNRKDKKLAIVFDIDETLLSNYKGMVEMRFGGTLDQINKRVSQPDDSVIPPTKALYDYALKHKVAIFLVTGRTKKDAHNTVKNLKNTGFKGWKKIYYKPSDTKGMSTSDYKTNMRKRIESKGYDIVLSVGDQESDLRGGYADKTIKLPNPFYFIP